jgi:hypothetical protein
MTAIQGYASILLEDSLENGHTEYESSLRRILSSTQHMLNLIGLLLGDPAKESAPGRIGFDINELIGQIEQMFYGVFPDRPLSTERDLGGQATWVVGDESEIGDIVTSLLIEAADRSEGKLIFRVARITADLYRVTILADKKKNGSVEDEEFQAITDRVGTLGGSVKVAVDGSRIQIEMDLMLQAEGTDETFAPSGPDSTVSNVPTIDFAQLRLPTTIWSALNEAAEMHSVTDVRKQIDILETLGPEYEPVALYLQDRCRAYDMTGILEVMQRVQSE